MNFVPKIFYFCKYGGIVSYIFISILILINFLTWNVLKIILCFYVIICIVMQILGFKNEKGVFLVDFSKFSKK